MIFFSDDADKVLSEPKNELTATTCTIAFDKGKKEHSF